MSEATISPHQGQPARPDGLRGIAADWASDQRAFKNVSWGKAMMWIFLCPTPSSSAASCSPT